MDTKILDGIEKPGRYSGGELNSIRKENAELHFALCFPDVYEVGMSHLGLQILYSVLNGLEDTAAERVFCPWTDMIERLRETGEPLRSLETGKPLSDFDIVGFSLSYELSYTNVLAMLELGSVPLLASDRGEGDPIVLGGGQCTTNPEPVADFFDLFVIGEGEYVDAEVARLALRRKREGLSRSWFLREAAKIDGVYVPSLYEPRYDADGLIESVEAAAGVPEIVRRQYVSDFEHAPALTQPIVPYLATVHDRGVIEIMRGCPNGCRFCQAGFITRPLRERSVAANLSCARQILDASGWEEIGLCSLSSGDYSGIGPLLDSLIEENRERRVSVSLPSMRMDSFRQAEQAQEVRKKGLTFAPEAGTQRLRDVINKNISEEEILGAARSAFEAGATHMKLYFMIGLPTETQADLDGIADTVRAIRDEFYAVPKSVRRGRLEIVVSVSNFVPKGATPFQWEAQDTPAQLNAKHAYLKEKLKMRGVRFQYHDTQTSLLEAVLARGDRRLGRVLLEAYRRGAVLDAWGEQFRPERYEEAFAACGLDPAFYASRQRKPGEKMPFDHIDQRISPDFLLRELDRAKGGCRTASCRQTCSGCGLEGSGCTIHAG
ncbi:MAG: TIGR03960 family B12-binding radical SAM protein [Clostridia bacterium]|nr:TIGR03960 family B12-binding radical SAM protein [Clostridia bacterium]